jgi:hypothetical protein
MTLAVRALFRVPHDEASRRAGCGKSARPVRIDYLILDEPEISSPIVMSWRTNDQSPLLAHFLKLIDGFDQWTETDIFAPRRKGALR